jgi:YD repeat-containing protein
MIINSKSITPILVNACIIFLLITLNSINLSAQQQQFPFKFSNLSVDNGLSHTDTHTIVQDNLGFLWIATLFGLDRYDGYTVKRFYNSNVPKRNAFRNRITSICLDENDRIWISSEDGIQLFDPRTEKYIEVDNIEHDTGGKIYDQLFALKGNLLVGLVERRPGLFSVKSRLLTTIPLSYPQNVQFRSLVPDPKGNIWFSSNQGIWLLDRSFRFRNFKLSDNLGVSLKQLDKVFINRSGRLLVTAGATVVLTSGQDQARSSPGGLSVLKLGTFQHLVIPGCTEIRDIIQDKKLNYWVSTDAGLFVLDSTFKIKQTIKAGIGKDGLNTNRLDRLFIDRSECLWVSTLETGINFCDLNAKPFYIMQHSENLNSLSGNYVRSILGEADRKLWIGTYGQGLNEYDLQTFKFKHYNTGTSPVKLKSSGIQALVLDNDNNLWVSTTLGLQIINKQRDGLLKPGGYQTFPVHLIVSLAKDCYGNIWFGSFFNGFGCIVRDKKNVYHVKYHESTSGFQIWADHKKPELFISTTKGLQRLIIDSTGNVIETFAYKASDTHSPLSSDYAYQVQKQNDSTYWIGTIGGGLNRLLLKKGNTYSMTTYGSRYGIFNDVEAIEFDNSGNLWMGGNGLERFNLSSKQLTRFDKNDGLQGNSFKISASYSSKDGRLYFGGINGLNYFYPDSIKTNPIAARPVFTDLLINNKKVIINSKWTGADENALEKSIGYSRTLHLNYLQNNFVISFSAMHYVNPQKCRYRYKLVGFDKEWKLTDGTNPRASYTNLDYDDYSFIVEATNNDGVWAENRAVIAITVAPPWWKSMLAKSIYFILLLSVLIGIYTYQARWYRLKRELSIHNMEEKKQEELYRQQVKLNQQQLKLNQQIHEKNDVLQQADEFKNKLVSILAHDFRAPLSSTITIASLMRENQGFTAEEMEWFYGEIEKDATNMLKSFDTILQWIRRQLSGYQFNAEALKLYDLFRESAVLFQLQMESKNLTFSNRIPEDIIITSDKEMLQFVNRNLLSNAIKFSPQDGRIIVGCIKGTVEFTVTVADDGPGMSETTLNNLFSISSQEGRSTEMGAGIALSMCKDFIKKLNGRIWAENKEPNGVIMYYAIPLANETNLQKF